MLSPFTGQVAAERIADLHWKAAMQRTTHELRTTKPPTSVPAGAC